MQGSNHDEAKILHGEVLGIKDVVTFQGTNVDEIEQAFKDSVDDYLAFCKERGEEPDRPFSAKFKPNLRPKSRMNIAELGKCKVKDRGA